MNDRVYALLFIMIHSLRPSRGIAAARAQIANCLKKC